MTNLGQQIRLFRQQQGIGLNVYARQLGVSPGYLSNLERGKTDNIQLSLLERLRVDIGLEPYPEAAPEMDSRIERIRQELIQLQPHFPEAVDFLLHTVEKGTTMLNEFFLMNDTNKGESVN